MTLFPPALSIHGENGVRLLATVFTLVLSSALTAAEPGREQSEFFEKKVRPILVENCYSCHSQAAKKNKGGLQGDSRAALLEGGDSGPAVVSGDPDKSRLIEAVRHLNPDFKMPPKEKLADSDI